MKNYVTITVRKEVAAKLRLLYEEEKKKQPFLSFTYWATEYLREKLEEDEILRRYGPFLEYIGISDTDGTIFIRDHIEDRIVEVVARSDIGKRILYCRYCEKDNCLHVGFCFAIKEINKALIERGFRQPKVDEPKDDDYVMDEEGKDKEEG